MNSRAQWLLARTALAAWLSSWFLPVIEGYPGWAAFRAALEGPFRHTFPTAGEDAILQVFSALTNVAFPIMFYLLARDRIEHAARFLQGALVCLIIDLYWLVQAARADELEKLLVGYYAWTGAFALLAAVAAISVASNRRTSKTPTAGTPP